MVDRSENEDENEKKTQTDLSLNMVTNIVNMKSVLLR